MTTKKKGDDLFLNRLLSYLKDQFETKNVKVTMIRKNVYLVELNKDTFIMKGFSSYHRLKLQDTFTASLKKEGFINTYSFLEYGKDLPLFFDQSYFGCLEYIKPAKKPFNYYNERDRQEGLLTLQQFHQTTEKLVDRYHTLLGNFKLLEKWRERTGSFLNNLSVIQFFIQKEMVDEFLNWADWSLKGMEKEQGYFVKPPKSILHGDVANHNFLRSKQGDLYLIDFDLISIGGPCIDYLQYANRILPYINWSLEELKGYAELRPFLDEKAFLYALAFPTDIFREWNRIVRERQYMNVSRVRQVLDLTVGQFKERQLFFYEINALVD
ncbi:phosphotransferase (plasmid) [Bacillus sp. 31A1R]|uniref:Phosphotransferase n=2 Tax=Robertmurraya mangrovi TaxID=3098077 RepID=A0ABU5IUK2_9BACI|nr:phosphotransferase [Bacillus sp. 31A1R]